jgi:hypothetical protein
MNLRARPTLMTRLAAGAAGDMVTSARPRLADAASLGLPVTGADSGVAAGAASVARRDQESR